MSFGNQIHAFGIAAPRAFVTTWKTDNTGTSNNDQITVPTKSDGRYDCYVDWGDGTSDNIIAYDDSAWTHTYSGGAGTYTVKIKGTFHGFRFANGGDKSKILTIEQWGSMRLGTEGWHVYGCDNLTIPALDAPDLSENANFNSAFRACTSLVTIPALDLWNTHKLTGMANMFRDSTLFNQQINFDTSKVTGMTGIFRECVNYNQPFDHLDTSSAGNMSHLFRGTSFNQTVDFDTSSVTTMGNMFRDSPFDQDVSGFDVEACNNFANMFLDSDFSQTNYDLLLPAWDAQDLQPNEAFHAGTAQYGAGAPATARANMVLATGSGGDGWTITDGGAA